MGTIGKPRSSPVQPRSEFGAELRRLRMAAGLTQGALAVAAGIERHAVARLETQIKRPLRSTIAGLERALNAPGRLGGPVACSGQDARRRPCTRPALPGKRWCDGCRPDVARVGTNREGMP
jgi:transcriptional regulator with XRE-family HTH domain